MGLRQVENASNSSDYHQWGLGESSAKYQGLGPSFPLSPLWSTERGLLPARPCPAPISQCLLHSFVIVSILDAVTAKMFEELKNQVDNLAQEVALLKEQQALQTGERRWRWAGEGWEGERR